MYSSVSNYYQETRKMPEYTLPKKKVNLIPTLALIK